MSKAKSDMLIIVRGGGDIATGSIHRLYKSGFKVLVIECDRPSAIRRQVAVCEAVYKQETVVEGLRAVRISVEGFEEYRLEGGADRETVAAKLKAAVDKAYDEHYVPVLIDTSGASIGLLRPDIVIDAILAKKNLGTSIDMAPVTIALGPGFTAGVDVDYVVETMRGHNLARIYSEGQAIPDTGVPGVIAGYDKERVIHSPAAGVINHVRAIGDYVVKGETIAVIRTASGSEVNVPASIEGLIRGLITDGYRVTEGFKIADIDPRRTEYNNCFTISDKARCIAGSVLELVCAQVR